MCNKIKSQLHVSEYSDSRHYIIFIHSIQSILHKILFCFSIKLSISLVFSRKTLSYSKELQQNAQCIFIHANVYLIIFFENVFSYLNDNTFFFAIQTKKSIRFFQADAFMITFFSISCPLLFINF